MGGTIVFLVSSFIFSDVTLSLCLINGAHSQSQLAETLIWEVHLSLVYLWEYSGTHGSQQPGLWVFMIKWNAYRWAHTQAHTCNHTPLSVNTFLPKEMAHLSWDIPSRLISLLKRVSVQGLAWDLVWSSWRGTLKMTHFPLKRGCGMCGGQSGQLSSCTLHRHLLPWIILCSESLKVVMALEKWLWVVKEEK